MESDTSSEGARISAARALLEYGLRFTDTNEIMTQLEDMERLIEKDMKSRNGWKGM